MTQSGLRPTLVRIVPPASPMGALAPTVDLTATGATGPRRSVAQVAKDIGLFFAAPFVTLAYVLLFPFIGMALFVQAWRHRKPVG